MAVRREALRGVMCSRVYSGSAMLAVMYFVCSRHRDLVFHQMDNVAGSRCAGQQAILASANPR